MKQMLLIIVGLVFSGTVYAAHGPAGCGFGTMLLKDKSGLAFNVLAATTNGSSGNQTFGMSTGTLDCDATGSVVGSVAFIKNNMFALSNDVSKGEGPTLNAYLTLVNAQNTNSAVLKSNFATIFSPGNSAEEVHNLIAELI